MVVHDNTNNSIENYYKSHHLTKLRTAVANHNKKIIWVPFASHQKSRKLMLLTMFAELNYQKKKV